MHYRIFYTSRQNHDSLSLRQKEQHPIWGAVPFFFTSACQSPQNRHLTTQVVAVSAKEKKNSNRPANTAPIILVAAKPIANRMRDTSTLPRIPTSCARSAEHRQILQLSFLVSAAASRVVAKSNTAIANTDWIKSGATVITAVIRKNAVTTPITALTTTASAEHVQLLLQPNTAKKITSYTT